MDIDRRSLLERDPRSGARGKILFITTAYPPDVSSHATRMVGLARGLSDLGWDVHVLTADFPDTLPYSLPGSLDALPLNVPFTRAWAGPLRHTYLRSSQVPGGRPARSRSRRFLARCLRTLREVVVGGLIPDTFAEWIPFALRAGEEVLKSFRADIIVSSSNPASCHIVGKGLAEKHHIPHVLDYGDPWNYLETRTRRGPRRLLELAQERSVLRNAALVSMTTEVARARYVDKWPSLRDKVILLEMGFDPLDFEASVTPPSDEFVLTYAGRIEAGVRNVNPLVEALASMRSSGTLPPRLRVDFLGQFSSAFVEAIDQADLAGLVRVGPWQNHHDFCRTLLSSHGLILLGNRRAQQVPGKLFQYLGAGRPILYLDNSEQPELDRARLLVGLQPYSIISSNNARAIREALVWAFSTWSALGSTEYQRLREVATDHTWNARARQLSDSMERLLSAAGSGRRDLRG